MEAHEICTQALVLIGSPVAIESLEGDDTLEGVACRAQYPVARDKVLKAFSWSFCRKRATLAALDLERTGYSFVYAVPEDYLKDQWLTPPTINPRVDQLPHYVFEYDDTLTPQMVIVTNLDEAELVYTPKNVPPALFPTEVADAIASELAIRLSVALRTKRDIWQAAKLQAAEDLETAKASDLSSGQALPEPTGSLTSHFITGDETI